MCATNTVNTLIHRALSFAMKKLTLLLPAGRTAGLAPRSRKEVANSLKRYRYAAPGTYNNPPLQPFLALASACHSSPPPITPSMCLLPCRPTSPPNSPLSTLPLNTPDALTAPTTSCARQCASIPPITPPLRPHHPTCSTSAPDPSTPATPTTSCSDPSPRMPQPRHLTHSCFALPNDLQTMPAARAPDPRMPATPATSCSNQSPRSC